MGKYGYIDIWILRIYGRSIYLTKNIDKIKIVQNSLKWLETFKNDKINKNTHFKVVL